MRIFPEHRYEFKCSSENLEVLQKLRNNTLIRDTLVSDWTKKIFIGHVNDDKFKIISSKIGRGAFCVLQGTLNAQQGALEIKIHKAFKILISILYTYPIIGLIIAFFTESKAVFYTLIAPSVLYIIFLRFIFTEITFYCIAKTSLKKFIQVTEVCALKRVY